MQISIRMLVFFLLGNIFIPPSVVGFFGGGELYQQGFGGGNGSATNNRSSVTPLQVTFSYDMGDKRDLENLTTAHGRVLFVKKRRHKKDVPRYLATTESKKTPKFPSEKILKSLLTVVSMEEAARVFRYLLGGYSEGSLRKSSGKSHPLGKRENATTAISKRDGGWSAGGIAFPSLEGALLSLAFLTFAVFLIDLVQNLLGTLIVPTTGGSMPGPTATAPAEGVVIPTRGRKRSVGGDVSSLTALVWRGIEGGY